MNELKKATQAEITTKTVDAAELEQVLKNLPEAERVALLYMVKGVELAIETAANRAS